MNYTRLAVLTFSIGISFVAHAQQAPKARGKVNVAKGKELFRQHCSACHGVDGKGKGSMYDPLSSDKSRRVPPADLTMLSAHNAGEFPEARVKDSIYSKKAVPGHAGMG